MANLVDVLRDGGLDMETVEFLLEALTNAEPSDWRPILEGFVDPEEAMQVLNANPKSLPQAIETFQRLTEEAKQEANKPAPNAESRFLDVFILGLIGADAHAPGGTTEILPGLLGSLAAHTLSRCMRLCRRARDLVRIDGAWEPRVHSCCNLWDIAVPDRGAGWRNTFLEVLRPRCDGIYVGECRYVHNIRPGCTLEARLIRKSYHWVDYRRYVRFLPPGADGARRALVLRDTCSFDMAAEALINTNPATHVNPTEPERLPEKAGAMTGHATIAQLRGRIAMGTYVWNETTVEIEYTALKDTYKIVLDISHGDADNFGGRLEWADYTMRQVTQEVVRFNLGRSPYGQGYPADPEKDHFPPMLLRQHRSLEHLLF